MHGLFSSHHPRGFLALAAAAWLLVAAGPARGGIVVSVGSVTAIQGSSGDTLEVDVMNTGAAVNIAAFAFEISVPTSSGITFTAADTNTSMHTYIFAGNSLFGPNIATQTGTTLDASDLAVSGSTSLGTNETLALGRVSFDVAPTASLGPVTVSLTPYPATNLSDPNLSNITIDTLSNGTITVSSGTVPEPSSLILASSPALIGALWLRRRRGQPRH